MSTAIRWFKKAEFDAPALKSPQPCIHGAGCIFTSKKDDGTIVPACCHFVHPGEEGNGRRLFSAVLNEKGAIVKPACVRLTGNAGFYERCRLKMPWQAWCDLKKIPYTPNKAGERHEPVKQFPINLNNKQKAATAIQLRSEAASLIDRLKMLVAASTISAEDKSEIDDEFECLFPNINAIISKVENSIGAPLVADDAAAIGKVIADGAFAKMTDACSNGEVAQKRRVVVVV
jgi:hypothetical protein